MIKIYYIEYENTVKIFNEDKTLELIRNDKFLINFFNFLRAVYKKYSKNIKFIDLMEVK